MKNDLTCAVARDLLPSYVEGLTAPETTAAVEAHLASCPDCAARREAMRAPAEAPAEEMREVDYLKKVKRRGWKRVLLAVVCTAAVIALCVAAKLFLIGEPASAAGMMRSITYSAEEELLHLRVEATESSMAYKDWAVRREGDTVRVTARKVLVSPLYRSGSYETDLSVADGVRSVYLGEDLIWQEGMVINSQILALYEARVPYVGDAPALGRLMEALDIQGTLGGYTTELKTSERPYDWRLNFEGRVGGTAELLMPFWGPQMLAVVGNLDQVSWTAPGTEGRIVRTLTLDAVNAHLAEWTEVYNAAHGTQWAVRDSVKDYTDAPASFQRLVSILKYRYETRRGGVDDTDLIQ